jgi:hypothetical protein
MEPEGSLLHLQVPAACPYSEPDQSTTCRHPILIFDIFVNCNWVDTRWQ